MILAFRTLLSLSRLARTYSCIGRASHEPQDIWDTPWTALLYVSAVMLALTVEPLAAGGEAVTRISDSNQLYWVEQVTEGLHFPSSMTWLPNGDMLITERMGGLRIVRRGRLDPKPISGTPSSYQSLFDGLKDVLLDPDYRVNRALYLLISEGTFDERHAAVYRARYGADGLEDVVRIFRAKDEVGGYALIISRMMFLADKTLLLAVTEERRERAQQLGSQRGKILRINRDGSIPKNNPFVNIPNALPEIWSYGHRVPLGLYQDSESGVIWEVEAGPRGGDELNVLRAGGNYGWAKASWGFAYGNRGLDAPFQSGPGIEDPILVWTPSVTPSGFTRYGGNVYPLWHGDYFVGHLSGKAIERLRIDGQKVVLQERLLMDLEERIRDVKVGPDQHLYVLTDHNNGRVLRLRPGQPTTGQVSRVAHKLEQGINTESAWDFPSKTEDELTMESADPTKGGKEFLERCAACHSIGTTVRGGEIGPDLDGIYGSRMGRKVDFDYSPNMKDAPFTWNFSTLNRFLANPSRFVPGTRMVSPPVTNAEVRENIIGFLKQQSQ